MSNTKAITAHMRANHPAQLQEAIALGIQRMRQYTGNLSPCRFCMTSFNKTHLCPVFLQMGILTEVCTSVEFGWTSSATAQ